MKPSPGVILLWRFATGEAERSGHEFIEPEHFVEAMMRGESLTDDTMLRLVIADESVRRATAAELAVVRDALTSNGVNAVTLRRSLRARLGKGDHPHAKGEAIHMDADMHDATTHHASGSPDLISPRRLAYTPSKWVRIASANRLHSRDGAVSATNPHDGANGAGDGNRTRVISLEG